MTYRVNIERDIEEIFKQKLNPGDVIEIWAKDYFFREPLVFSSSGIEDNYITIRGKSYFYTNPTFSFIKINHDPSEKLNGLTLNCNYVRFENINISYAIYAGLLINGNNNYIKNVDCSYNLDSGIKVKGCNNILEKCTASYNFDPNFSKPYKDRKIELPGFNSDGISDKLHDGPGNTFIDCISHHNGDDGFDFFFRNTPEDQPTKLIRCIATNNGPSLFETDKIGRKCLPETVISADYIRYVRCKGNGNGFKLGGKRIDTEICNHNVELDGCIAIGNYKYGFFENHNNGKITLNNCNAAFNREMNYSFNYATIETLGLNIDNCYSLPYKKYGSKIRTKNSPMKIEDSNLVINDCFYERIIDKRNGSIIRSCLNCKYLKCGDENMCTCNNIPINFKVENNRMSIRYERACKYYIYDRDDKSRKQKEQLYLESLNVNAKNN